MADPIDAKTVAELMQALDERYGLDLPTSFPAGTELAQLWAARISVTKPPGPGDLYQATGLDPIPITIPSGTVSVTVAPDKRKEERRCRQRKRKAKEESQRRRC